jgi:hypothetical protein
MHTFGQRQANVRFCANQSVTRHSGIGQLAPMAVVPGRDVGSQYRTFEKRPSLQRQSVR